MRKRSIILSILFMCLIVPIAYFTVVGIEYAYVPPDSNVNTKESNSFKGIRQMSSNVQEEPDHEFIQKGRKLFYEETFGNEVFFTDVMGMFDGALTLPNVAAAIIKLNGQGTDNLQVQAAKSVMVGDIKINKGDLIDTGLDVPKGALTPLGVKVRYEGGKVRAGISCAVCHSSLDDQKEVVHGIPNADLNIGLLVALATNSASYFTHTEMKNIQDFITSTERTVKSKEGDELALPDIQLLEKYVDQEVMKWPRGGNDTTIDLINNPVQTPDVFTLGDHPYGWSGQGQLGPFKGLSAIINNAHAQNMDAVSQMAISKEVLGIDKELYVAILLQNASDKRYRFDPESGESPTDFLAKVDPTPNADGVLELIESPSYPKVSFLSSVGLFASSDGYRAWEQLNSMSAFMNSLKPPKTAINTDDKILIDGKSVFNRAGCIKCHAGQYLTNNQLMSPKEIGTESSRARALNNTEKFFSNPGGLYDPETPVPLPDKPIIKELTLTAEQEKQLKRSWGHTGSDGAYKVPSLVGLYWSAPYLHDGGVAVGQNLNEEIGVNETLYKGKKAVPINSLLALIDSELRQKVVKENVKNQKIKTAHVSGEGHEFWVDHTTGFTKEEQQALIMYLLTVTDQNDGSKSK
ncbi:electron transport protein [Metabacillus halosaccharovorans]|uniref:electron transport protein n=1 Tax=Metabacillus halosaccharovorans TaxID=930124 RepID=UPI00203C3E6E|nr:electron transport protein [Metabacillus halosaccharovorans]MCM3440599.1 electron transport protein [Metabacillus halosaccharovorans]